MKSRLVLTSLLAAWLAGGSALAAPNGPTTWGINTNIDVWPWYAENVDDAIAHVGPLLLELPVTLVREGLQRNCRGNNHDPIDWDHWFNPWVRWLAEHEMQVALEIFLNDVDNPGFAFDEAWEKRVTHKALEVSRYVNADPVRRKTVAWFILMNEPDLHTGMKGGFWTPERLVRMHELAWAAIKSVNPDFLIEGLTFGDGAGIGASFPLRSFNLDSPVNANVPPEPGKSVPGMTSKAVIDLGITRFCDVVGYHSYLEITEDFAFGARALVENMRSAHEKFGYPIRPTVNTETGPHETQFNQNRVRSGQGKNPVKASEEARWAAHAHWQQLNRVQQARWAVSRSIFYLLSGSPGAPWMHIADYPMKHFSPPAHYGPFRYDGPPYARRPSFATAAAALAAKPLATLNGGFEEPEDKFSNWVVHYHPHDFRSDDFVYGEWRETHFQRDGAATGIRAPGSTGTGYLRLDRGLPKLVRRVIEGLAPDREYELSAWVRQEAGSKSTLAAYGFDQAQPGCAVSSSSAEAARWVRLSVRFKTRRSAAGVDNWAVASLEHDGGATAFWDDVALKPVP